VTTVLTLFTRLTGSIICRDAVVIGAGFRGDWCWRWRGRRGWCRCRGGRWCNWLGATLWRCHRLTAAARLSAWLRDADRYKIGGIVDNPEAFAGRSIELQRLIRDVMAPGT